MKGDPLLSRVPMKSVSWRARDAIGPWQLTTTPRPAALINLPCIFFSFLLYPSSYFMSLHFFPFVPYRYFAPANPWVLGHTPIHLPLSCISSSFSLLTSRFCFFFYKIFFRQEQMYWMTIWKNEFLRDDLISVCVTPHPGELQPPLPRNTNTCFQNFVVVDVCATVMVLLQQVRWRERVDAVSARA
jgi:hypothetical protein